MAEGKVRFVRCPKCQNVLPELPDYSVYRCGGCGAVLRAKLRNPQVDILSDGSDAEREGRALASTDNFPEGGRIRPGVASESSIKSNGSSSFRCDQRPSENDDVVYAGDDYSTVSKPAVDKWVVENDSDIKVNRSELGNANNRIEVVELDSQVEVGNGSRQSGPTVEGLVEEKRRFSALNCPNEGSSSSISPSVHGYCEAFQNHDCSDGPKRVESLKQDKAELLRKLDELKDQLSRSCDVGDKTKEKAPQDRRMLQQESYGIADSRFAGESMGLDRTSMQFCSPNKLVTDPPQINQYPEPHPCLNRPDMAVNGLCPSMHTSNHIPFYGDPYGSHVLKRATPAAPCQYQQPPSHVYYSGHCMSTDLLDPYAPHTRNAMLHQSSCSCLHCYSGHREATVPVLPPFFHKGFPDVTNNPMLCHYEKPDAFGARVYNPRSVNPPPLSSRNPHVRCSSGINPELGAFARSRPQAMAAANPARSCQPVAGGAPLITCRKCFELLQLPEKIPCLEKTRWKVKCGACSAIIVLAAVNRKIIVFPHTETIHARDFDDCSNEPVTSRSHGHFNRGSMNFYSDDSGYDFQSMDKDPVSSSTGQGFGSGNSQDMQSIHSSSLASSEDEDSPDGLIAPRETTIATELSGKAISSPPLPGSPLQEHFDYSGNNHVANRFGKGNKSKRSDQDKVLTNKTASRQNSLKDVPLATETEVSFNEYSNTGTSQGSASREGDLKINKGSDSFFAGIKKSFRDFSRPNQTAEHGKTNITVNGHPLTDRAIKKAEKLAGPIHHGQYWYDSRAGFWGVMGGPCLGIIPPFIEEFNHPMPANCAAGNAGVFVNGRELHQKDLDLLAGRGLPTDRDRSYIIEISGRVLDEDTGEELDSLGKLAPTVERTKHGFGMKPPRVARQTK